MGGASGSDAGGSATSGAGTLTSGAHSVAGTSTAGGTEPGHTTTGGASATGGNASAGEAPGGADAQAGEGPAGGAASPNDGWPCGNQRCTAGQTCTRCLVDNQTPQLCVPNPDRDPAGYASATAKCEAPPFGRDDCDGPEDCAAGQHCVARQGARCQAAAATRNFCCFSCNSGPDCTLCHTNQDCSDGQVCEPNEVSDSKGCHLAK